MADNGGDGGITTVECPECSDAVTTALPHYAEVVSVITNPQNNEHDIGSNEIERPRENQIQCGNEHTLSILYDW